MGQNLPLLLCGLYIVTAFQRAGHATAGEAPQWANLGNATSGSEKSNINRGELWGECAPLIRCDDNGTSPLAFLPQAHNLS